MSQWYYAGDDRRTHGPISAEALAEGWRGGRVPAHAQVWREGWPQWRALDEVRDELGLSGAGVLPPPLPPGAGGSMHAGAPPRGLSGRIAALIVAACAVVVALPLLGVVAALALPAYRDHAVRSRVTTALAAAEPVKQAVEQFHRRTGHCPDNAQPGFRAAEAYASAEVASITVGTFDDGSCGVELVLGTRRHSTSDGKRVWWSLEQGRWTCSSELPDRGLPPHCRG